MKETGLQIMKRLCKELEGMTPEEFDVKYGKPHEAEMNEIMAHDYTNNTGFYIIHPETGERL